jgi:hypothetical protein
MTKEIKYFATAYNHRTKKGYVMLDPGNPDDRVILRNIPLDQFNAINAVLQQSPVYFDEQGWIKSGKEQV